MTKFATPEMEVIHFTEQDVIVSSAPVPSPKVSFTFTGFNNGSSNDAQIDGIGLDLWLEEMGKAQGTPNFQYNDNEIVPWYNVKEEEESGKLVDGKYEESDTNGLWVLNTHQ